MPDEIDMASNIEDFARSTQIALCEREASKPIPTSDVCLNCDEPTVGGGRWCDADCRDTWSKEQSR